MTKIEFHNLLSSDLKFSNVPGTVYEYSNLGYAILGEIIEAASGEPYQDYITKHILVPLGMLDTKFEIADVPADKLALGYKLIDERWVREPMLHDGAFGAMVCTVELLLYLILYVVAVISKNTDFRVVSSQPLRIFPSTCRFICLHGHLQTLQSAVRFGDRRSGKCSLRYSGTAWL